jgi:membrane protein DedA with SNARE-associated domain
VVRHLISIPAGIGRMPVVPFLLATVIGATLWNGFLLICGMKLREHWDLMLKYAHEVDIVVVLALLAGMIWFARSRLARRRLNAQS